MFNQLNDLYTVCFHCHIDLRPLFPVQRRAIYLANAGETRCVLTPQWGSQPSEVYVPASPTSTNELFTRTTRICLCRLPQDRLCILSHVAQKPVVRSRIFFLRSFLPRYYLLHDH
jgi:hypothetical protein